MSSILISIKPEFVSKIFNGTKKYEFRTKSCKRPIKKLVVYATAPIMKVVGEVEVKSIIRNSPDEIWDLTKNAAGISADFFYEYFHGRDQAVAYCLDDISLYDTPKDLSTLGVSHAPQSFMYLD